MPESSPSEPESSLLQRSITGDRTALDTLIARHRPSLRAFVRLRISPFLRGREEEDDIVQSVCRELIAGLEGFEYQGETRFRNWLYVAVLNKLRQKERYYRAAKRSPAHEATGLRSDQDQEHLWRAYSSIVTPSQELIAREQMQRLEQAFDQLRDEDREVITWSRIVGLGYAEIAEQMGRTEGSVRNLLSRALVKLSAVLERLEPR